MRRNLTGYSSRGKFFNTCLKATVLVLLFAVLCLAFSFSVSGVASADTSVSQTFANSSSAAGNEAVVSGSDDDSEAVTSGEATVAGTTGGTTPHSVNVNLPESNATSWSISFTPSLSSTNTSAQWNEKDLGSFSPGGSSISFSTKDSNWGDNVATFSYNVKLNSSVLTHILRIGGKLSISMSAKFKTNDNDIFFWGLGCGINSSPNSGTSASNAGIQKKTPEGRWEKDSEPYLYSYDTTLSSFNKTNATTGTDTDPNSGAVGLYFSFLASYEGSNLKRYFNITISDIKISITLNLPDKIKSDSSAPTHASSDLSPYITSMSNLPYTYGNAGSSTDNTYANFSKIEEDLAASIDSGNGTNTSEINLKSYTNKSLGTQSNYKYYKTATITIKDSNGNKALKNMRITATGTEAVDLYCYNKTSSSSMSGTVTGDNGAVYYYSISWTFSNGTTQIIISLKFFDNVKLTISSYDFSSNSQSTVLTVSGIEKNDSTMPNVVATGLNDEETTLASSVADLSNNASWVYTLKSGDNGASILRFSVENSLDNEYIAPLVYYYRLYYSPNSAGLSTSPTEVFPTGLSSYKYTNGYVFGYKTSQTFSLDLALTNVSNYSGYYKIVFSIANMAGKNVSESDSVTTTVYYFKVDADTEESTLSSDVKYTDSVDNIPFTDYLTNEYGLRYYWLGLKDLNSNGLYPTLVTTITLAGETRKGSLATTLGNNLSGNTLRYTKANGDEASVVVRGGVISSLDSSGGTVGSYEFMGAT